MRKRILSLILLFSTLTFADRLVIDTTMAASTDSDYKDFEDRGSFGPYLEFNNIKMKNVDYSYKVNGRKHTITVDNTYIYGASGSLPLTEWFDIYLMAGYQYLGVSHKPRNKDAAYKDLEDWDDFFEAPFDSSDIEGRHEIHTALFQLGFDFALPLVMNYKHQFMIKLYAFGGAVFGKTSVPHGTDSSCLPGLETTTNTSTPISSVKRALTAKTTNSCWITPRISSLT